MNIFKNLQKRLFYPTKISVGIFIISTSLTFFLRSHSFHEPLEADEALYSIIVKDWIDGGKPYITLWDNKPIGTFIIYRCAISLFGDNEVAPKIAATLSVIATSGILLAIFVQCKLGSVVTLLLMILWSLISCSISCYANGANSEIFLLPFTTGALLLVNEYSRTGKKKMFWLAQLTLTLSLLIKQVTLPYLLIPFLIRGSSERLKKKDLLLKTLGVLAMVLSIHMLVYTILNYPPNFLVDQVLQNASYATQKQGNPLQAFLTTALFFPFDRSIRPILHLTALSLLGLFICIIKDKNPFSRITLMFIFATSIATALPGENFPHYYILFLPLILLGLVHFFSLLKYQWQIIFLFFVISIMAFFTYSTYLSKHPNEISYKKYNNNNWFVRDRFIGMKLKEIFTEKRIFVDGSHPGIFFYSDNKPATKYFVAWNYIAMRITTWEAIFLALQKSPPYACVLLNPSPPTFKNWLNEHYEFESSIAGANIFISKKKK